MSSENLYMSQAEKEARIEVSKEVVFASNFNFLLAHRGYRQGCIHTILGPAGGGKSTLVKSLLMDIACVLDGRTAGLILSEQSVSSFKDELANFPNIPESAKSIAVVSERDKAVKQFINSHGWIHFVRSFVEKYKCSILVIDNMTTSISFVNEKHQGQNLDNDSIKQIAEDFSIPIVLVYHTSKGISDNHEKMITEHDTKYTGHITSISEFFYILQRFHIEDEIISTIRIAKHRGQPVKDRVFKLIYNQSTQTYLKDVRINGEAFHQFFNDRNESRKPKKKESYSDYNKKF